MVQQRAAEGGEFQPAAAAVEQLDAVFALQALDVRGHRGLLQRQRAGGRRHAARARGRVEGLQGGEEAQT